MKNKSPILNLFYVGGAVFLVSLGLIFFVFRLQNNLFLVTIFLAFCLIYAIIFAILDWRNPDILYFGPIWDDDAGAAWQRKTIKEIQNFCLFIDKKIKTIFKK